MAGRKSIRIGELTLPVTNLDKVLYPATGTTKGDVLDYLIQVAPALIPQAAWRPATRKRWVDGVGTTAEPGNSFFRKDIEASAPAWLPTGTIAHKERTNTYPLANNAAVLAWFAQLAALEIHVPQWRFGADGEPRNPDRLVIDLDPGPATGLPECARVARAVREILGGMGLRPVPVTSGSKGIHIYAPLDGSVSTQQASAVARQLASALEEAMPELVVATQKKALRDGKVLVDWSQNNGAKTTVCPYSLRGRAHPDVAAPRTWDELEDPGLAQLDYRDVLRRLADGNDPLREQGWLFKVPPGGGDDALARYRAKRDSRRTPEPIPDEVSTAPGEGGSEAEVRFVIQEHHARRLHWDLRLEHDGVFFSWAVPKGAPMDTDSHRLAVQTEDHPLEYGTFEGTIPKGEYGGGTVTIWDSGAALVEKWRNDEIIVELRGRSDGGLGGVPRRYALVRTAGSGEKSQWLLILTKDQPDAVPLATLPEDLPAPMLASRGTPPDVDGDRDWAFEMKWDGIRAICAVGGGQVRLVSRNGNDMSDRFPELAELSEALQADAGILDGEIVALDESGRPDFGLLQQRLGASSRRARQLAGQIPVTLMLFDVLALTVEGKERRLMRTPYRSRRRLLEAAVVPTGHVKVPDAFDGSLTEAQAHARAEQLEGVVAKQVESVYQPGRRSRQWIKLKEESHQAVIVVGWHANAQGRPGSLLVAVPDRGGGLSYAGRVGSGLTPTELADLESRFRRLERKAPSVVDPPVDQGQVHWMTPELVGEVAYAEQTAKGRLRHPVWRGWRHDLGADEVAWEGPEVAGAGQ